MTTREWRALQWLHERAPDPLTMREMLSPRSESIEDDLFLGVSYLQARGWVRIRHTAWSFTLRGEREAPDRATAEAVKLPAPAPARPPRVAMPVESISTARMAAVLSTIGDDALHAPDFGKAVQERDFKTFSGLIEVCMAHGFSVDDAIELSRLIRVDGGLSRGACDLAMCACADVAPQSFVDVLKPFGLDWLLTDPALEVGTVH
ncbi:MAG: hypothetical protein EPO09_13585 [Aquabacterium sp.]|nr:MAG: hypothetical protein EPO09_13585 [Aquabacterium sp.]